MAPIDTTVVVFKDYVNDGKVPEDNFVIKHDKVGTKLGTATQCRMTTLHDLSRQILSTHNSTGLPITPRVPDRRSSHPMTVTLSCRCLQVDADALKEGEILVSKTTCQVGLCHNCQ